METSARNSVRTLVFADWQLHVARNGGAFTQWRPGLVQQYFYLGQPLLRRPKQSGSVVANFHYGKRVDANLVGYFRGHDLDVEPNYGASEGFTGSRISERRGQRELPGEGKYHRCTRTCATRSTRRYEEIYGFRRRC